MLAILDTALESKWHVRAEVMTPTMPDTSTHLYNTGVLLHQVYRMGAEGGSGAKGLPVIDS